MIIRTKSERVSSRHRKNKKCSQSPNDKIRSQRRAERLRGDPKLRERQHALPTSLSDTAGKPNNNRNHVAERRKSDEEVQSTHGAAVAEDFVEEQSGCREVGVLQLVFGNWESVS
jgi:hypothetical protein